MTPAECNQYRAIGGRLAHYMQQQRELPPVATLQAVAADLAADQNQLVLPLRELVARPGFAGLASRAGSGNGALECQALLQGMETTFTPTVIAALAEVLCGLLNLPSPNSAAFASSKPSTEPAPSAQPKAADSSQRHANSGDNPPERPPAPAAKPTRSSSRGGPVRRRDHTSRLVAIAGISAVAVATAAIVSSGTSICEALGLCVVYQLGSTSKPALDAASAAEQALRRAQNLTEYRQASERLERALLQLSGDNLTLEQQRLRQQLQTTATQSRSLLKEEKADLSRLNKASQAITTALMATGPEREQLLSAARQALEAIPPRSFSAGEAERLRKQISALAQEAQQSGPSAIELGESQPKDSIGNIPSSPSSPAPRPRAPQSPLTLRAEPPDRDQPLF